MWEFTEQVECPHCGDEGYETISFNDDEADQSGIDSSLIETTCSECSKTFYFTARLQFEVEIMDLFEKKPRPKKPPTAGGEK